MDYEDEAFNDVERLSATKQRILRESLGRKRQVNLMQEVELLTGMVRDMTKRIATLEEWKDLTDQELFDLFPEKQSDDGLSPYWHSYATAVIAAFKEKNK